MPPRRGRQKSAHSLECEVLERAAARFQAWRRDWYDEGGRVEHKHLAALRASARAFHEAVAQLLNSDAAAGSRARVLARMQEAAGFQQSQAGCADALLHAMHTALWLDRACDDDVRPGRKADPLLLAWVWAAADEWAAAGLRVSASDRSRFVSALLAYAAPGVPTPPGADAVGDALRRRAAAPAVGGVNSGGH